MGSRSHRSMIRLPHATLAALTGLCWAAAPAPVWAAASFDCAKASTTAEKLICGDGTLIDLDGSLGDAFQGLRQQRTGAARDKLISEQRAWLADRDRGCGIPAGGSEPTLAQRWAWAPCLADRYRERLTQLGIAAAPVQRPPAASAPGFVHPLCLDLALGGRVGASTDRPVPVLIEACNRGHRHVDVEVSDGGYLGAGAAVEGFPAWFAYSPVGQLAGGDRIVVVSWNGGGSGTFSEVAAIHTTGSGSDATISARTVVDGGDRCNGGIESAKMSGTGSIDVAFRATPGAIISAGDSAIDTTRYDLDDCAICCAGTVTYRVDTANDNRSLTSVTITERLSEPDAKEPSAQVCFDRLVGEAGRTLPRMLTASELAQLAQRFRQNCATAAPR